MRISGLAERTGLPVATLKYYLREGLLPPGEATSPNQARYDETHVERVRLVRALTEVGGLDLATVGRVLTCVDQPEIERLGILGSAQRALLGAEFVEYDSGSAPEAPRSRSRDWVQRRGWQVDLHDPVLDSLDRAWDACDAAGIGVDDARLDAYADAIERIADVDVASVPAHPQAAVRQVVLGTVLVDPLLVALRRLAHQHVAVTRQGGE